MERRSSFVSRFHTKGIKLGLNDLQFLLHIKNCLNLNATPIPSLKEKYLIIISNKYDSEILSSILYYNILTTNYQTDFNSKFALAFNSNLPKLNLIKPEPSLNNGWLAGYMDAHISIFFKGINPIIRLNLSNREDIFNSILILFPEAKIRKSFALLEFTGDNSVNTILDYLKKYPPKLHSSIFN